MKVGKICACLLLGSGSLLAKPSGELSPKVNVIPKVCQSELKKSKVGYQIEDTVSIQVKEDAQTLAFTRALDQSGVKWQKSNEKDAIEVILDKTLKGGQEAYALDISPEKFTLRVASEIGSARAVQTILQLICLDAQGKKAIPAIKIEDFPRFRWRGMMADVVRQPKSVADMKRLIDLLAFYKLNTLHWHLTDDQGWRIEIKKYPKLVEIGSKRKSSPVMGNRDKQNGIPVEGFFTQDQIKEVVQYAKDRFITIVPEIELPGHAAAAIASYPELGNVDIPDFKPEVKTTWGVHTYTFAPTEKTFEMLGGIIEEVAQLFPDSPYLHIGGDEAPKDQWEKSAQAKKIMKDNGLKNAHELQSWFIRRIEKIAQKHGKQIVGWDEIVEGGLSPTATMMYWRSWQRQSINQAIAQGNHLVMTPNSHCYFDYGQGETPKKPWYDFICQGPTVEKVYSFDPLAGIPEKNHEKVLGVQANVWAEYIPTMAKLEYQIFPRLLALSEVAWSPQEIRQFKDDFQPRWKFHEDVFLKERNVNFRKEKTGEAAVGEN